jgi:cobalt-zinc-cadmium efflux system outer membrane protein
LLSCISSNTYAALNTAITINNTISTNIEKNTFPLTLNSAIKRTLVNNPQLHEFDFR